MCVCVAMMMCDDVVLWLYSLDGTTSGLSLQSYSHNFAYGCGAICWIVLKLHNQNRFTFNFVEYFGDLSAVILRFLRLLKMASAQFSLHYTAEEVVDMLDVSD